ncbi:MAG TPA: PQQ-binding-like beta-propeller repeat protein [Saprospiraceae bacterium]|nr:PQQ-binding-like beta-propeller repeat protein [Saprospiraceae bacterium]
MYRLFIVILLNVLCSLTCIDLRGQSLNVLREIPFLSKACGRMGMFAVFDSVTNRDVVLMDSDDGRFLSTMYWDGEKMVVDKARLLRITNVIFSDGRLLYEDIDLDGTKELFFNDMNDIVVRIDPNTLEVMDTIQITSPFSGFSDLIFEDPDQDGHFAWYCVGNSMYVFDSAFTFLYDAGESFEAEEIMRGQFDALPGVELALLQNNSKVLIIDGSTFTLKNEIQIGFNQAVDQYDFDGDGIDEIVVLSSNPEVRFYDAVTDQIKALISLESSGDQMIIGDLTDHPGDELFIVGGSFDTWCYGLPNRNLLWVGETYRGEMFNAVSGDFTGTGKRDLFISEGANSSAYDEIGLIDGQTGERTYRHAHRYEASLVGQVNRTHGHELIMHYERGLSVVDKERIGFIGYDDQGLGKEIDIDDIIGTSNTTIVAGAFRAKNKVDLVFGDSPSLLRIFDLQKGLIHQTIPSVNLATAWAHDIDQDGLDELVVARTDRSLIVFKALDDGQFVDVFVSLPSLVSQAIVNLEIIQADSDAEKELAFNTRRGAFLYDLQTQLFVFDTLVSSTAADIVDIDVADANGDDRPDLVLLSKDRIRILDVETGDLLWASSPFAIKSPVSIDVIMADGAPHFIVFAEEVQLYSLDSPDAIWRSPPLSSENMGLYNPLFNDFDDDGDLNILVQSPYGLFEFECDASIAAGEPLLVTGHFPGQMQDGFPLNGTITIEFNDTLLQANELEGMININAFVNGDVPILLERVIGPQFKIKPMSGQWPAEDSLSLTISGLLHGHQKGFLDGNNSGVAQGNSADDFILTFKTSSIIDTFGPVLSLITAAKDTLVQGVTHVLRVQIADSSEQHGLIAGLLIGVDSIAPGSSFMIEAPVDFVFDESTEQADIAIRTTILDPGKHTYLLQGFDDNGNAGTIMTLAFEVIADDPDAVRLATYNLQHTGSVTSVHSIPYVLEWDYNIECQFCMPRVPVIWDGMAVVGERDFGESKLFFLDLPQQTVFDSILYDALSQPSVFNGQLYYAFGETNGDAFVSSVDLVSENENWRTGSQVQGIEQNSPLAIDDRLLIEDGMFGGISCLDRWTGELQWFHTLPQTSSWSPVIDRDTVHLFVNGYYFKATLSGELLHYERIVSDFEPGLTWSANILDTIGNQILWMGNQGLYAFDLRTAELRWVFEEDFQQENPVLANGRVYAFVRNEVFAVNSATGDLIKSIEMDQEVRYAPVLLNSHLLVPLQDKIVALDHLTLRQVWELPLSGQLAFWKDKLVIAGSKSISVYRVTDQCYVFSELSDTLCFSDTLTIGDNDYVNAGQYADTLQLSMMDCDTIYQLTLTANPKIVLEFSTIYADNWNNNGSIEVFVTGGSGELSYLWSNQATSPFIQGLDAGPYTLTVSDAIGCSTVFEFEVPVSAAINEVDSAERFFVMPNPFISAIRVKLPEKVINDRDLKLTIFDLSGRLVFELSYPIPDEISLMSGIRPGMYLLQVTSDHSVLTKGIVKLE